MSVCLCDFVLVRFVIARVCVSIVDWRRRCQMKLNGALSTASCDEAFLYGRVADGAEKQVFIVDVVLRNR